MVVEYGTRSSCTVAAVVADADAVDAAVIVDIPIVVGDSAVAVTTVAVVVIGFKGVGVDILDNRTTAAEDGGTGVKDDLPPIPATGKTLFPGARPCPCP